MPKECSVCISPNREQIDIEIVNGTTVRDIAARFSLSRSSIGRHRVNCHKAIIASTLENSRAAELLEAAKQAEGSEAGVTSLTRADEMYRRSRKAVIEAFKRKDYKVAFMGLREARGFLELISKLGGELTAVEASRPIRPIFQLPPDAQIAVTVNHRVEDDRPVIRNVTPEENPPENLLP